MMIGIERKMDAVDVDGDGDGGGGVMMMCDGNGDEYDRGNRDC